MTTEQYQIGYEAGYSDGFEAAEQQASKPLTDEQINEVWQNVHPKWNSSDRAVDLNVMFARAIEAAHGITGEEV